MTQQLTSAREQSIIESLFRWWPSVRATRDELPWRTVRDPWLTLMAELMLGQTQVSRVAQRFSVMAERFPTPKVCAQATQGEVIALWIGLGYNRRAIALHRSAVLICERHGGEVPRDLDELLALPGVGPYTARAVLAFAYGDGVGVLDTNIGRVFARAFVGSSLRSRDAQLLADRLVEGQESREWNLAIMDFGNLVCRSRMPQCDDCVLHQEHCRWRIQERLEGITIDDPAVGSGGVSTRQSTFNGSDRQGRGRLVRQACLGPISPSMLVEITGWHDEYARAERVAEDLVAEGILHRSRSGNYQLA
jgi:A/G-specific adenine glycosylase